jgi:hypothetical protein
VKLGKYDFLHLPCWGKRNHTPCCNRDTSYEFKLTRVKATRKVFLNIHTKFCALIFSNRPPFWIETCILHVSFSCNSNFTVVCTYNEQTQKDFAYSEYSHVIWITQSDLTVNLTSIRCAKTFKWSLVFHARRDPCTFLSVDSWRTVSFQNCKKTTKTSKTGLTHLHYMRFYAHLPATQFI